MKKSLYLILLIVIFVIGRTEVSASSGALRKNSIKMCNGIIYGQHSSDNHWHVAEKSDSRYYATGDPIYNDPCSTDSNSSYSSPSSRDNTESSISTDYNENGTDSSTDYTSESKSDYNNFTNTNSSTKTEIDEIKSNDNTLKSIVIDGEEINVEDNINYSTKKKIIIKVITNDKKAKYEIKNNSTLKIGENKILVEVTAEDGTTKTYNINVKRDKILSSDKGIMVIINDVEVKFKHNKATIYVSATEKKPKINCTLNDKNAKIEMSKIKELKFGDNELKIKVIAEDGTEMKYEITIHRNTVLEEVISWILTFVIIGGIVYCIYYGIKNIVPKFKNIKLQIRK